MEPSDTIDKEISGPVDPERDREPNFLLVRDTGGDWPQWKHAAVGSVIFHIIAITALFLIKGGPYGEPPPEHLFVPYVTHLYVPKELTQKAPNKGPLSKMITAPPPAVATPKLSEPAPKAAPPVPPAPTPAPKPQTPPAPQPTPPQQAPVETARNQAPAPTPPPVAVPKPDAPKMIVEDSLQLHPPAPKAGSMLAPSNPVQEAMRAMTNGGPPPSHTHVGDSDEVGVGSGLHLSPSALKPQSSLEIKSDPMGVDFRPYLLQVLQAVRTNWFAVYPEAARLGMRGRVVLEFTLAKGGKVIHLQFAGGGQTGAKALDQAAIASITASDPLPSLPKEFKGDSIVLQMTFMYNMPR